MTFDTDFTRMNTWLKMLCNSKFGSNNCFFIPFVFIDGNTSGPRACGLKRSELLT